MSALGKCQKCKREITLPSVEGIEEAAENLDKDTFGSRGGALAYLWMIAACMRGTCITCMPERLPVTLGSAQRLPVASA